MADQQRNLEDLKTAFFKKLKEIEESHRYQVTALKNEFRQEFDRLQSSSSSSSSSGSSRRPQQRAKASSSREVEEPRPEKPRVPRTQQKKDQASEQTRDPRRSQPASRPAPAPAPSKAPAPAKEAPKPAPVPAKEPAPLTAKGVLSKIFNSKGGVTQVQVDFLKNHLLQIGSNDEELTAFVDLFHSFACRTSQRRRKGAAFADLCETLHKEVAQNKIRFRAKLLQKCQSEFEAPIPSVPFKEETKEEDAKKLAKEKGRKLGNAGLIAYLVRNGLLKDSLIFNDCILPMLKAEDLDINRLACCCRVVRILGPNLDSSKGKDFLDPIFASLQSLSSSPSLSSSSSLPYLLSLRAANWVVPPSDDSSSSSSSAPGAGGDGKQEKAPAPRKTRERKPRAQVDDGDQSQAKDSKDSKDSKDDQKKESASDESSGSSEEKKRKRGKAKSYQKKATISVTLPAEPSSAPADAPADAPAPAAAEEKKNSEEKPAAE